MAELNEQIHIEDPMLDVEEGQEAPPSPPQASMLEAFQHYACLYIKYMQIFTKLERCYDQMVHPQKRIDVKQVLEVVMVRTSFRRMWLKPGYQCLCYFFILCSFFVHALFILCSFFVHSLGQSTRLV